MRHTIHRPLQLNSHQCEIIHQQSRTPKSIHCRGDSLQDFLSRFIPSIQRAARSLVTKSGQVCIGAFNHAVGVQQNARFG